MCKVMCNGITKSKSLYFFYSSYVDKFYLYQSLLLIIIGKSSTKMQQKMLTHVELVHKMFLPKNPSQNKFKVLFVICQSAIWFTMLISQLITLFDQCRNRMRKLLVHNWLPCPAVESDALAALWSTGSKSSAAISGD